jgi:osmotically-inducible protein OsmY
MIPLKRNHPGNLLRGSKFLLTTAALAALTVAGCHSTHPDDKAAVYSALDQNKLASVTVAQDRDKGVITLSGIVGNQQSRSQAQSIAEKAAPGYSVKNELRVNDVDLMKQANPKDTLDPGSATTMPSH